MYHSLHDQHGGGGLPPVGSASRGLHPGGSASTGGSAYRGGVCIQESASREQSAYNGEGWADPQPELGKREVRILPECFLVENRMALFT